MNETTGSASPLPEGRADGRAGSLPARMLVEFHSLIDAPMRTRPAIDVPGAMLRVELVEEETRELREAVEASDLIEVADALADLAYVVYGGALHFGIDLDAVLTEVHRSNMTKTGAGNRKAVKGPGYSPPDIAAVLRGPAVSALPEGRPNTGEAMGGVVRQNDDGSWSPAEPIGWLEEHNWLQRLIFWLRRVEHCNDREGQRR